MTKIISTTTATPKAILKDLKDNGHIFFQRTDPRCRYGKLGTIANNQGYISVSRCGQSGKFTKLAS